MSKRKKKNHSKAFWICSILILAIECFLAYILQDHWMGLAVIGVTLIVLATLRISGVAKGFKAIIAVVLAGVVGFGAVALARPDKSISFQGNLLNNAIRFKTLVIQHKTPEAMAASLTFKPYTFGKWKAPSGYTNEEIKLTNCSGYLLKKDDGDHGKVVYQIHGGAYVLGYNDNYNNNAVLLSKCWDDADVFSIDYRSAAVAPYPAPMDDAVEGYQWLLGQGYAPENIVVAGDSAGGGLSLGMTLKLRDDAIALPRCLVLSSPWADVSQEGESYTYNRKNDASFGSLSDDAIGHNALPTTYADGDSVYNPYISPVYADYECMPPMLIQVGATEMLLSDSLTVAEKAEAAGVNARLIQYKGMWHTFYTAMAQFREQKEAWKATEAFIHEV